MTVLSAALLAGCGVDDDSGLMPIEGMQSLPPPSSSFAPAPIMEAKPDEKTEFRFGTGLEPAPQTRPAAAVQSMAQAPAPTAPRPTVVHKPAKGAPHFPVRRCMNMGNALEAETEGEWGYTIEAAHFTEISRAGFDTVRIPVRWDAHTQNRPPYAINPAFMTRIQTVTAQAQRAGLGVIIDVHHYDSLMQNPVGETAKFLAIWEQISAAFKGAPDSVYFEILNEPMAPMTMADANRLYARVLPIIRKHHPRRAVIMGGDQWNSIETIDSVMWPNDPYLVATFHDYGPHEFTHQGASWMDNPPPTGRVWGERADMKELKDTYDIARRFKAATGLPVFVGEFGVIDTAPHSERVRWTEIRRKTIEAEGMSWCAWDFAGAFKTYDVNERRWLPGMRDALTGP